jgi:hypothetical protein
LMHSRKHGEFEKNMLHERSKGKSVRRIVLRSKGWYEREKRILQTVLAWFIWCRTDYIFTWKGRGILCRNQFIFHSSYSDLIHYIKNNNNIYLGSSTHQSVQYTDLFHISIHS